MSDSISEQELIGGETCKRCGHNVAETAITWWQAPDELWLRVYGTEAGIRCIPCFTKDCDEKRILIYWQAVEVSKHVQHAAVTECIEAVGRLRDKWAYYCSMSSNEVEMRSWGHWRDAAAEIILDLLALQGEAGECVDEEATAKAVKSNCDVLLKEK